jgi:CCR4-NOT transcription complex subunit 9
MELSNRICIILSIFQFISSHDDTIFPFVKSNFPFYILPFLKLDSSLKENQNLKLSTLGVLGALIKSKNPEVIDFFMDFEVVISILKIIESGCEISKLVANCIIQKILNEDKPLDYFCRNEEILSMVFLIIY